MADNDKCDASSGAWGTLEELLLACAVCRHGLKSWDSIAMEVQKRCSNNFFNAFTPQICERRYHALKRRFDVTGDAVVGGRDLREELPFMIEELRKLRVEELRREVERHDVSIVSLQLKVKGLEAEGERSSAEDEADLATRADRSGGEPGGSSAEAADKPVSRDRSESDEPEDRSFNESNSTNRIQKPSGNGNNEPDPVRPVAEPEPDKDFSSNRGGEVVGGASQQVRLGNAGELRASVTESKKEVEESSEAKQSSDVQSSASLPRRKRRRSNGVVSCSSDEIEAEEVSPANKRMDVKSQPLIKFLEIVRSHRHGSVFLRRLPSQETQKYSNFIRQHMDLETVQSKLNRGFYCDCHSWFFRDLLLIFTNAILFFCKSSTEHLAARELRRVVAKEIAAKHVVRNPKSTLLVNPDLEARSPDLVAKKPITTTNIVVCRRRRNSASTNSNKKTKSKDEEVKNGGSRTKSSVDHRKKGNLAKDEPKKLKMEMSNLATNNNANPSNKKKSKGTVQQGEVHKSNNSNGNTKGKSSNEEDPPINKRMKQLVSSRKEGLVSFLKRMKENSPSKEAEKRKTNDHAEEKQEERAKITGLSKKKVVARKKMESDGGDGKGDGAATIRVSGRRSARGVGSETTRRGGGGRLPTRKAAAVGGGGGGGAPDSGRSKRRRDGEVLGATPSKKKPRR